MVLTLPHKNLGNLPYPTIVSLPFSPVCLIRCDNVEICDAPPARTVPRSTKGDIDIASDNDKGILGGVLNAVAGRGEATSVG